MMSDHLDLHLAAAVSEARICGYDQLADALKSALDEIERLRAEVERLQREAGSREHHIAVTDARAKTSERELAELREMIEKAPMRRVISDGQYDYAGCSGLDLFGKRVRLVVED